MRLSQIGDRVTGAYENAALNSAGTIEGTVAGATFTGRWSSGATSGMAQWTLNTDGKTFDGFFVDTTRHQWCGARPDHPFAAGCSFAGTWTVRVHDRSDCQMQLTRTGMTVTGVYCEGRVEGVITSFVNQAGVQTVLDGAWERPGREPGTFRFYLFDYEAQRFGGHWRGERPNEWCGWRDGASPPDPCLML